MPNDMIERLKATAEALTAAADNPDFPAAYLNDAHAYADEANAAADRIAELEAEVARLRAERDVARRAIGEDDALDALQLLTLMRGDGWRVAVHNDYRQHRQDWTFWLFTRPDGRWVKGEGVSDALALDQAHRAALAAPDTGGADGE